MGKIALAFLGGLCVLFLACPGPTGPQITELTATPAFLHPGDSTIAVCQATGQNLAYDWHASGGTFSRQNGSIAVWFAPTDIWADSVFTLTVEVWDSVAGKDHEVTKSVEVTVDVSNEVFEPLADAYVASTNPGTNYGAAPYGAIGCSVSPTLVLFRSYLRFDLSSIPSDAHVEAARLCLWHSGGEGDAVDLRLQIAVTSWSENAITWANQPITLPDPTIAIVDTTWDGYVPWAVTDFVRDWVRTPTGNQGLMCKIADEDTGFGMRQFITREGQAGRRPYLEVVYW